MKQKILLDKDKIALVSSILLQLNDDDSITIPQKGLLGGNHAMEDVAIAIGKYEERIKGSEDDCNGSSFPEELTKYMEELYHYVSENLYSIMSIVMQFCGKGGIKEGTYEKKSYETDWKYTAK